MRDALRYRLRLLGACLVVVIAAKVIVPRLLDREPRVTIVDAPAWG